MVAHAPLPFGFRHRTNRPPAKGPCWVRTQNLPLQRRARHQLRHRASSALPWHAFEPALRRPSAPSETAQRASRGLEPALPRQRCWDEMGAAGFEPATGQRLPWIRRCSLLSIIRSARRLYRLPTPPRALVLFRRALHPPSSDAPTGPKTISALLGRLRSGEAQPQRWCVQVRVSSGVPSDLRGPHCLGYALHAPPNNLVPRWRLRLTARSRPIRKVERARNCTLLGRGWPCGPRRRSCPRSNAESSPEVGGETTAGALRPFARGYRRLSQAVHALQPCCWCASRNLSKGMQADHSHLVA